MNIDLSLLAYRPSREIEVCSTFAYWLLKAIEMKYRRTYNGTNLEGKIARSCLALSPQTSNEADTVAILWSSMYHTQAVKFDVQKPL